ncbi:hypothetical protein CYY_010576, partial [Polysphondylium violaceum]
YANLSFSTSIGKASVMANIPAHVIKYHRKKLISSNYHCKQHGGDRSSHLTQEERVLLAESILDIFKKEPLLTLDHVKIRLENYGFKVTKSSILKDMNWTYKKVEYKQHLKYTDFNLKRYFAFLLWVNTTNWDKLVFMDEVHFSSRDMRKQRSYGHRSETVSVTTKTSLSVSFSMSCMVRFNGDLYTSSYRSTNDQFNSLQFIKDAIEQQYLCSGDTLILDNATVHLAAETHADLMATLQSHGINIHFLPAYSPELNPIERVFGYVKNFVRLNRTQKECDLTFMVQFIFRRIPEITIKKFFMSCLRPWYAEELDEETKSILKNLQ